MLNPKLKSSFFKYLRPDPVCKKTVLLSGCRPPPIRLPKSSGRIIKGTRPTNAVVLFAVDPTKNSNREFLTALIAANRGESTLVFAAFQRLVPLRHGRL